MEFEYKYSDTVAGLLPVKVIDSLANKAFVNYQETGEILVEATLSEQVKGEPKLVGNFVVVIDNTDTDLLKLFIITEEEYIKVYEHISKKTEDISSMFTKHVEEKKKTNIPVAKGLH